MYLQDVIWATLLLIVGPFRAILRLIYGTLGCMPKRSMKDEIVLVTGAAQGLGRGISLEFARLGATVVCWDINEKGNLETAAMAERVSEKKGAIHAYRCDISKREEVISVAERVKKEVGNVTMLINNAGIITAGLLETYPPEDIVRVVNTNYLSHFWTIEAFLPHMKLINSGQIVCISSMAALIPADYMVPYASTKSAVTGLMDSLAEELVSSNYDKIILTTVHPAFTKTNSILSDTRFEGKGPKMMEASGVVKKIVDGVMKNEREFTVPGRLMPLVKFIKFYPRDVIRACRILNMGRWDTLFQKTAKPISAK